MTPPIPRRRQPWGKLWVGLPWDGRPRPADPDPSPVVLAFPGPRQGEPAPPDAPPARRLRRMAFGRLLRSAPWAGSDAATHHGVTP